MGVTVRKELTDFQNLLGNMQATEKENNALREQIAKLQTDLNAERERNKHLKKYQWIEDAKIKYWEVTVCDKVAIDGMLARCARVFGEKFKRDVTADDKEINRYARQHVDYIVTAAVKYVTQHEDAWQRCYAKYIIDNNRVEGVEE